jgi:hypothetical protein
MAMAKTAKTARSFEDEVVARLAEAGVTRVDEALMAEALAEALSAAVGDYFNRARRKVAPLGWERAALRAAESGRQGQARQRATPRRERAA